MNPLEQGVAVVALCGSAAALVKLLFAGARFFSDLAANLRALTDAVRALTLRLDDHGKDFGHLRERVAALESWREDLG